ncbi:ATP-binding protein [Jhaorihella thermophila]
MAVRADGVVVVEDDGPGIPEAELSRVFEPFVRLERSRSRETGGTGLGLSIARSILTAQGGSITLENRAEGGLRVLMRLPR